MCVDDGCSVPCRCVWVRVRSAMSFLPAHPVCDVVLSRDIDYFNFMFVGLFPFHPFLQLSLCVILLVHIIIVSY